VSYFNRINTKKVENSIGDIVLIPCPWETGKIRPAVVSAVSDKGITLEVHPITSNKKGRAKLRIPSGVIKEGQLSNKSYVTVEYIEVNGGKKAVGQIDPEWVNENLNGIY
jgi:hypothetical protein